MTRKRRRSARAWPKRRAFLPLPTRSLPRRSSRRRAVRIGTPDYRLHRRIQPDGDRRGGRGRRRRRRRRTHRRRRRSHGIEHRLQSWRRFFWRPQCGFRVRLAQRPRRRFNFVNEPVGEPFEDVAVKPAGSCGQPPRHAGALGASDPSGDRRLGNVEMLKRIEQSQSPGPDVDVEVAADLGADRFRSAVGGGAAPGAGRRGAAAAARCWGLPTRHARSRNTRRPPTS